MIVEVTRSATVKLTEVDIQYMHVILEWARLHRNALKTQAKDPDGPYVGQWSKVHYQRASDLLDRLQDAL